MARLMLQAPAPDEERVATRIGGRPLAPQGTLWPMCSACDGPMQFLAQVRLVEVAEKGVPPGLLLLFQCQNKPGQCDEWDAMSGGNAALRVTERGAILMDPPVTSRKTLLDDMDGVKLAPLNGKYEEQVAKNQAILGVLGGAPLWIQSDETPSCPKCKKAMRFAVQLEERGGGGINFGDAGNGYGFVCSDCPLEAKFLWQCA
jgi:uncharacterized protein YwqG